MEDEFAYILGFWKRGVVSQHEAWTLLVDAAGGHDLVEALNACKPEIQQAA